MPGISAVHPSSFCIHHSSFPPPTTLNDLNFASHPAFAVDHLAALFGAHSGSEADFSGAFDVAGFMGIMHGWFPKRLDIECGRSLAFLKMPLAFSGLLFFARYFSTVTRTLWNA
jgi:hypothetical protein